MYNRLIKFLNDFDILYDFQFDFRTGHSPNIALIYLVDNLIDSSNNGKFVIGLFLYFKKAFDTVNPEIMLSKSYHYGIRGVAHKWFGSYLNNREQYVEYAGTKSELNNITCGIPQGSILGPLLFLLYINDLANVSNVLFSILFADDSNLFISGGDPNDLVNTMNKDMIKVIDWLRANKLTLNTDKTHFVLFRRQQKLSNLTQSLIISGQHIAQVKSTKFLGIIIDDSLKWGEHAKYVKGKISRGIGILCKARRYFNLDTLKTLYYAFLFPHLYYCIEVWGNTFNVHIDPLEKMIKRALRLISGSNRRAHTTPLFENLEILTLRKLYVYSIQVFMYKFHHKLLPRIFLDYFVTNYDAHDYNTRQRGCLHATHNRSHSIRYVGVKISNHFMSLLEMNMYYLLYKNNLRYLVLTSDVSHLLD